MSNPLKAIGKVFRKVVKVVRKVALPALAIGAAILTGGAALGVFPGTVGSILGGAGIHGALAGILTTAGQGALGGILTSAVTGKNVLKGATTGFVLGGVAGGIGQIARPAAAAASGATSTVANATDDAITVTRGASSLPSQVGELSKITTGVEPITVAGNAGASTGNVLANTAAAGAAASTGSGSAGQIATDIQARSGGFGSLLAAPFGMLDGLDPYTRASVIKGIGSGILAGQQDKAETKREREKRAWITANYEGSGNFFQPGTPSYIPASGRSVRQGLIWKIDPVSGEAYQDYDDRGQAGVRA